MLTEKPYHTPSLSVCISSPLLPQHQQLPQLAVTSL